MSWQCGSAGRGLWTKPDNLISIPRTHMTEERTNLGKLCHDMHAGIHTCFIHMQNKQIALGLVTRAFIPSSQATEAHESLNLRPA